MRVLNSLICLCLTCSPCVAQELVEPKPQTDSQEANSDSPNESKFQQDAAAIQAINEQAEGYRGIWYFNQKSDDEFVYKYSGGMGTYSAKHRPFAVYSLSANKTFFCYGGATETNYHQLVHMVSYFDHDTKMVARPTMLLDKRTSDAHDNPIISVDHKGYVWIFSTSHGLKRPSFVHRSVEPHSVERFERVAATYLHEGVRTPLDNFSYMQTWPRDGEGFVSFFTRYGDPAARTLMFMSTKDGKSWSSWQRLAAIEHGHYQVSTALGKRAATAFNYHPLEKGLNHRTNLYYMETRDGGESWNDIHGKLLKLPLTEVKNPALVRDYVASRKNVYLKDIQFDGAGRPVILFVTSGGYESGPDNDPRTWTLVRWTGRKWKFSDITTSDNNYDMGSIYLGKTQWRLVAPTEPGPQAYNPGGEMCMWVSKDKGAHWQRSLQLTQHSVFNHTYSRRPLNAHPEFYAFWADGHGRQPSESRLYFCNYQGEVFQLPTHMDEEFARPLRVPVHERAISTRNESEAE